MLTKKEIRDVILATFCAHRRSNEKLYDDYHEWDEVLSVVRKEGITLSDEEWEQWNTAFITPEAGMSTVSPATKKVFLQAVASVHPTIAQCLINLFLGKNVLFLDTMVEEMYAMGWDNWRYVEYYTLHAMLRMRYRSIMSEFPSTPMDEEEALFEWADNQLCYGIYRLFD